MLDVIKRYSNILNLTLRHPSLAGGHGGADKISFYLSILRDMGYRKVVVIVDNNKKHIFEVLGEMYKDYKMLSIPTDDIRNKKGKAVGIVKSISPFEINKDYLQEIQSLMGEISNYFKEELLSLKFSDNLGSNTSKTDKISNTNEQLVNDLLEIYFSTNKDNFYGYAQSKYPEVVFRMGGGEEKKVSKISENIYKVIQYNSEGINDESFLKYKRTLIVNMKNSTIKKKRVIIVKNTLPINIFRKYINKILT